ncbi:MULTISPECIES: LacI family DNA-binding transcriptional regulator [Flavobacteriaceae]|uniref:LacI family DNA-binding transcriptional regulator n=1 Tax=Flavobacteriaceae TaxID=49546 RepID=UPI0014922B6C|nr:MULTISPECIES: LacI family DNA-binding transcriptional regulator [Allomuricauda]MDC6365909.1 LacI family DNA-binding transcriptional regulator [Muricauda sp. AC10]
MKKKTTIYDIAKKLNITAATVSRALNNNARIGKATKELVLKTAREMDYEPNKLAQALKIGKSNIIGVIVPYINRNFFSNVIRGIEDELYPKGYHVIICQTHDTEEREVDTILNLLNAQVEGILISLARFTKTNKHFEQVLKKNIPLIFFDRKKELKGVSSVTIDDFQGAYEATQHLVDQGSKRIAHLTVEGSIGIYIQRLAGYKQALLENNLAYDENLVIALKSDIEEGKQAAQTLMTLDNPPDAIFSSTDHAALGVFKWLSQEGYDIPKDVSLVGFSNEPFTQFMQPSISSIDQAPREMGKMAARVFLEQVSDTSKMRIEKNVILSPTLLTRDSSSRLTTKQKKVKS